MSAPRIVLDTNAALDLLLFADPRCAALRAQLGTGALVAVTDDACRAEWRRVLRYPAFALDDVRVTQLEAAYDALTVELATQPVDTKLPRCKDPDDQMFLELARDAGAIAVITRDDRLLELSRRTLRAAGFAVVPPDTQLPLPLPRNRPA